MLADDDLDELNAPAARDRNLFDLIRKRHSGEGWQVFTELANGTGWKVSNHADAAALGIWPSHGHELHGYEIKRSRGDVQKELAQPWKADGVGKYCDYWWLVISDPKIIDGLVIPKTWGILSPKSQVLRTIRKAPKLPAKKMDRAFIAAMIRNVTKTWVPKQIHDAYKADAQKIAKAEVERDRVRVKEDAEIDLRQLKDRVETFQRESGLDITSTPWLVGNIGKAVKAVISAREMSGKNMRGAHDEPAAMVRAEIAHLRHNAERHETAAKYMRGSILNVEHLLKTIEADE